MRTLQTPSSSWLAGIAYDHGTLAVALRNGAVYAYSDVPPYIPGLLMAHRSPGRAYGLLVRGKYQRVGKIERTTT